MTAPGLPPGPGPSLLSASGRPAAVWPPSASKHRISRRSAASGARWRRGPASGGARPAYNSWLYANCCTRCLARAQKKGQGAPQASPWPYP